MHGRDPIRLLAATRAWDGRSYWRALIDQESGGPRWLGTRGEVHVLTPWAPIGFHEVWLLLPDIRDIVDLADSHCADIGVVLSGILAGYHGLNLASFNWALYGNGPAPQDGDGLLLRVVSRSNPDPFYRSDVTYFERLHAEAMIDMSPEAVRQALAPQLAGMLD